MNVTDYTYLMNKPDAITEKQADALGSVLNEFPYFQSARALRLKGLYNQNSFKYNYALKVTAAHTSDRSVLFDFITSEAFTSVQNDFYEQKLRDLLEITVFDSEIISPEQIRKALQKNDPEEQLVSDSKENQNIPVEQSAQTEKFVKTEEPVKTEEILKVEEPLEITEPVNITESKIIPEIDPSIFLAIKEAQTVTFEKPVIEEKPKTLPEIDPSIFMAIKEAQLVTYEKPVIEEKKKADAITVSEIIESVEENEISSFTESEKVEEPKFEETKIDRIENSILSSIKVSETLATQDPIQETQEEPKFDRIQNSILSSIKEAETTLPEEPVKKEESKTEAVVEQSTSDAIEEEEEGVIEEMIIPEPKLNPLERSILSSIKEAETVIPKVEIQEDIQEKIIEQEAAEQVQEEIIEETEEEIEEETTEPVKTATEHLEIGKPLDFSLREKHSFQEWLQLSRTEPIDRSNDLSPEEKEAKEAEEKAKQEEERQKKASIIDKFIENNPKISPIKPGNNAPIIQIESAPEDNSYLMTETLARVYLEQKKYTKAIQAYEILILKYPEKITFFADRISDIKILQQNNNNNN
ncbi:hypothetical protein HYN56_09650 [Flavobacterium crocinum]|uniref:Tetratricopeptide repeat protein n=1 Tax=Flavobacterium crocinum TaxID=2183896 RepID=A0A2S1YKC5_9FLAO|nr:tetratricopeptide repeat protein [Flavobacterium crocinum]AWK04483.1 hypothetical protein HYN56_09650 [Flavobacterium crocinum]